ncbi:MAG TPA: hypothetical protein QF564_21820 [Pirellulaceae bacterium]|nr:hypothetical protein [Pirellulaceae bacterium]
MMVLGLVAVTPFSRHPALFPGIPRFFPASRTGGVSEGITEPRTSAQREKCQKNDQTLDAKGVGDVKMGDTFSPASGAGFNLLSKYWLMNQILFSSGEMS